MGSIVLDEIKVRNNVIPNLSRTKTIMQAAYSTCNTLKNSLPSSFSSRSMVSSIATKIASSEKKVTNAYNNINLKMDYVKRIESKTESKVSSLASTASKIGTSLGMITGAAIGSAGGVVGTAVGAATGAVVGKATGEAVGKIVETGAKVTKKATSAVKGFFSDVGSWLKKTGTKIAKGAKAAVNTVVETAKDVGKGIKEVTTKAVKAVKNTGAKIVDGVTSTCKKLWNGAVDLGKSFINGCKNWFKKAKTWVDDKFLPAVKNLARKIANVAKDALAAVTKAYVSFYASVWNVAVGFTKGVFKFGEAIFDGTCMLLGGIVGGACDLVKGVVTGEWNWNCTSAIYKHAVYPIVSCEAANIFDYAYSDKAIDFFKKDGIGIKIAEGVGYYTGVVTATAFTGGALGATSAAASFATTFAVAGVAELGKSTQDNYNNIIEQNVKELYVQELSAIYPELSLEQVNELVQYGIDNDMFENYEQVKDEVKEHLSQDDVMDIANASYLSAALEGLTTALLRTKIPADAGNFAQLITKLQKVGKGAGKAVVQGGKAFAKEGITTLVDGEYDTKKAIIDAIASAGTELISGRWTLDKLFEPSSSDAVAAAAENLDDAIVNNLDDAITENLDDAVVNNLDDAVTENLDDAIVNNLDDATVNGASNTDWLASDPLDATEVHEVKEEAVEQALGFFGRGKQGAKDYMLGKTGTDSVANGFVNELAKKTGKDLEKEGINFVGNEVISLFGQMSEAFN